MLSDKEQAIICGECVLADCDDTSPLCRLVPILRLPTLVQITRRVNLCSDKYIAATRRWQKKNPKKAKAYKRKYYKGYYADNREAEIARISEWSKANRERTRERYRRFYADNREAEIARVIAWRKAKKARKMEENAKTKESLAAAC